MEDQANTLRQMMQKGEEFSMLPTVMVFEEGSGPTSLASQLAGWFDSPENLAEVDYLDPGALRAGVRVRAAAMDDLDERLLHWHPEVLCVILLAPDRGSDEWVREMIQQILERRPAARIGIVVEGVRTGEQGRAAYEAARKRLGQKSAPHLTYLGHWTRASEEESSEGWLRKLMLHFEKNGVSDSCLRMVARRIAQAGMRFREEPARPVLQAPSHEVRA